MPSRPRASGAPTAAADFAQSLPGAFLSVATTARARLSVQAASGMDLSRIAPHMLRALAVVSLALVVVGCRSRNNRSHLGPGAWSSAEWQARCAGVRTSFNPSRELSDTELTLAPGDPRWLDFVYWAIDNKVAEHQVEAYGGTGWDGPQGGVIFHWAPGSHWERDTLASFGFTLGHTVGEHRWLDTMFPDFFERYGGVYGVNVKDRMVQIDPASPAPWIAFLDYGGSEKSPYYRYLFHQESVVNPERREIDFIAGQGVAFTYSYERYYHELREVLTDCRAVSFFDMYDRFGPGFAAQGNWARQNPPSLALARAGYDDAAKPGVAEATRYDPHVAPVAVPEGLPEHDAMARGQRVYLSECAVCHGIAGDGKGFLAHGLDVKPRDFTSGTYKLRSTASGELPTIADLVRTVRVGVPVTSMPARAQFLTDEQIGEVARYLVVFSPRFAEAWRTGTLPPSLPVSAEPADLASLAPAGRALYIKMQCATCHGSDGRGLGASAAALKDEWGEPVRTADLTYRWTFKNGNRPADVYRTIYAGLNGTPMPAYGGMLGDERDRWALVAAVLAMSPPTQPVLHLGDFAKQRATRIGADGRVQP
jgi:mono/diheme cytochrome c family protein